MKSSHNASFMTNYFVLNNHIQMKPTRKYLTNYKLHSYSSNLPLSIHMTWYINTFGFSSKDKIAMKNEENYQPHIISGKRRKERQGLLYIRRMERTSITYSRLALCYSVFAFYQLQKPILRECLCVTFLYP